MDVLARLYIGTVGVDMEDRVIFCNGCTGPVGRFGGCMTVGCRGVAYYGSSRWIATVKVDEEERETPDTGCGDCGDCLVCVRMKQEDFR